MPPPQNSEQEIAQRENLEKNVKAWGDTFSVAISFDDVSDGGLRVTAEAKSIEAKARFISLGLLPGITKVFLEIRRINQQEIVVAYAEIPKTIFMPLGLIPDRNAPQVKTGQDLLTQFLGGSCHMI